MLPRPAWLGAALVLALQISGFRQLRHDDAYITFRYGQNLASGRGLVFNPGERLMGSTSPGQALLAAATYPLLGAEGLPTGMSIAGCVGWTAQALFLLVLLGEALGAWGAAAVALAIAAGAAGSASWVALETNLSAACALGALALAVRRKPWAAAVACAAAGLFRPDALLILAPLAALWLRDLRGRAAGPLLLAGALSAPWFVFAWAFFGSPLPQSAAAKFHLTSAPSYLWHLLSLPAAELLTGAEVLPASPAAAALVCAAGWALAAFGVWVLARREARTLVLPAWGALHFAAYAWLRPGRAYGWHLYPLALVFAALAFVALVAALQRLPTPRLALGVALAAVCAVALRTARFSRAAETDRWLGARDRIYRDIAAWMRASAGPDETFSSIEIGTLAYWSDLRANDEMRLVTPDPQAAWRRFAHGDLRALRFLVVEDPGALERARALAPWAGGRIFRAPGWTVEVLDLARPSARGAGR